jgi:hypothetical protein
MFGDVTNPDVVVVRFTVNCSLTALAVPAHVVTVITAVLFGLTNTLLACGITSVLPEQVLPTPAAVAEELLTV